MPTARRRTVVVTGASRGIGAAIRDRLLARGHTVIGIGRTVAALPGQPRFVPVALDLAQLDALPDRLAELLTNHPQLDGLVANAGAGRFGHLEQHNALAIRRAVELNLLSPMLVVRALLPALRRNAPADVVLMGSEAALRGSRRGCLYSAAKFGLRGFAQALRAECAAGGVRVTQVHPGLVRTSFFDDLDFAPGEAPEHAILPGDVAEAVDSILHLRSQTVVDEIVLSPLTNCVQRTRR
ncbi:MAG: SDR family oxidoreductase [Myxococcales bacterium FL481]|nr:MAG: SDR family oxidoreductase [Myxococcales bacterium FL481]